MSARLAPLQPPYEPAIESQLIKWMPPNSGLDPLALFRTLAHHPNLFDRMRPLGAAILGHGTLSPTHRELLINRTCAICGCEYEWGVHVASFGKAVGLSPEKLAGTVKATPQDALWEGQDSYLLKVVDELHQTNRLSDELWANLTNHWTSQQIIEMLVIVGFYHLISYVANGLQVEPEAWAASFPQ